jgi:hypothetical protein
MTMKTTSIHALFALPMFLLAGCGVDATADTSADGEDAPVAESAAALSAFVFDTTGIAQAPSATLPTARLTLTSFQDALITRALINTTESFTQTQQLGSKTQMEGTQWSFGKDPTAGQVLVVRKTPSGPATTVDEALLQRNAITRLNTWGIPNTEIGTVMQRQSLGEHQDGTSPATTRELHRYKTFVFRAINGVRVQGHRAVVSHTPDGTFNRVLVKWPPIASTGHTLRTPLSVADIQTRAEAALLAEGETGGAVTLRWKYVPTALTTGEVTLALKVSAVTSPAASTQGATGQETREITVDVDAQ